MYDRLAQWRNDALSKASPQSCAMGDRHLHTAGGPWESIIARVAEGEAKVTALPDQQRAIEDAEMAGSTRDESEGDDE